MLELRPWSGGDHHSKIDDPCTTSIWPGLRGSAKACLVLHHHRVYPAVQPLISCLMCCRAGCQKSAWMLQWPSMVSLLACILAPTLSLIVHTLWSRLGCRLVLCSRTCLLLEQLGCVAASSAREASGPLQGLGDVHVCARRCKAFLEGPAA